MILLDADVLLIELRYTNDPRFSVNQQALHQMAAIGEKLGITCQALLETVGNLSFGVSQNRIPSLPHYICSLYGLTVLPDFQTQPDYAGCTVGEIILQIGQKMALGDAVQAAQIARFASFAKCLLTWNAKHFQGKLVIPVLTPQEWLDQQGQPNP